MSPLNQIRYMAPTLRLGYVMRRLQFEVYLVPKIDDTPEEVFKVITCFTNKKLNRCNLKRTAPSKVNWLTN